MEHLPPVGWADVASDIDELRIATKRDFAGLTAAIDSLRVELTGKIEASEARSGARLERELRLQTWRLVTVAVALSAIVTAGVRF